MRHPRKHLSFANVISVIALMVALGGGAYAAVKIDSGDIKNKTIKNKDVKPETLQGNRINESSVSGLDRCPASAPTNLGGICYSAAQGATNWDAANQTTCRSQGLRAPTIGEALLVMTAVGGGPGNETWTDEVTDLTNNTRGLVKAPGDPQGQIFAAPVGSAHSVRCVTNATN
jgi:hypothetical protein